MQKMTSNTARTRLMVTASTIALLASALGSAPASAGDDEAPLWIELGGQIEALQHSGGTPDLPLGSLVPQSGLSSPLLLKLDPSHSDTGEAKITYSPDGDWSFSASVRFGRTARKGSLAQALAPIPTTSFTSYKFTYPLYPSSNKLSTKHVPTTKEKLSGNTSNSESHFIIDFNVGKDVGLGLFGHGSKSTLSAGVRFAQFVSSREVDNFKETAGINFQSSTFMTTVWPGYGTNRRELWDTIAASGSVSQKFMGLGPSITWEASAPLWNDPRGGNISFDWGANAALLFGKQTKKIQHQSSTNEHCTGRGCAAYSVHTGADTVKTTKNITVPNVGGFAAVSLNYSDIKVTVGYRADLFMSAFDAGFASRRSSNLLFHGPYASLSIGLGD